MLMNGMWIGKTSQHLDVMRMNGVNASFVKMYYSRSGAEKIKMATHGFVLLLMHEFITPNHQYGANL